MQLTEDDLLDVALELEESLQLFNPYERRLIQEYAENLRQGIALTEAEIRELHDLHSTLRGRMDFVRILRGEPDPKKQPGGKKPDSKQPQAQEEPVDGKKPEIDPKAKAKPGEPVDDATPRVVDTPPGAANPGSPSMPQQNYYQDGGPSNGSGLVAGVPAGPRGF